MQIHHSLLQRFFQPASVDEWRFSHYEAAISLPLDSGKSFELLRILARSFVPAGRLNRLVSSIGALCGLLVTGAVCKLWLGGQEGLPWLIAPMGASAVLVFAVPASPLAQPWPVLGGNVVSALAGIACAKLVGDPFYAGPCAVALAITLMSLLRCLHPPGGAVALTAAIGGPAIAAAGWSFTLMPVALNTLLLVGFGLIFNNATRHSYPHRVSALSQSGHGTKDPPPQDRVGFTAADLDSVLARYDELLDVSRDDLDALFRAVEARAHRRLHGEIRCSQIMSRDLVHAEPQETVESARRRLAQRNLRILPVVGADRRIAGIVGFAELAVPEARTVAEVMRDSPCIVSPDAPIDELLPILSGGVYREAIVATPEGQLLGLITQTDLLAALWRSHVAELVTNASASKESTRAA